MWMQACSEEQEVAADELVGNWEVVYAERNGKTTELVKGARFSIEDSGMMTTDITGKEQGGEYVFENGAIHHHSEDNLVYKVRFVEGDSMGLHVDIRGLKFMLQMVRLNKEE